MRGAQVQVSEIWRMLARTCMELILSQRSGASGARLQINIDLARLPDRYEHCQLSELLWKETGS